MATIKDFDIDVKGLSFGGKVKMFFIALKFLLFCLFIFSIAFSATLFFSALSIVYTFFKYTITFRWTSGAVKFAKYVYQCALSVDQTGNVTCQEVFNDTMIKRSRKGHKFGDEDDTISYCIAMNEQHGSLSKFGKFWAWFLNFVDKKGGGHTYKALINKITKDFEAYRRLLAKGQLS